MRTVLIIDDDPAILEVIGIVLESEGYQVQGDSGAHVYEVISQHKPDLVLLDIWMNGVDGREVARQLKKDALTRPIPVILMSAHSNAASAVRETGADDFLEKPFDLDELVKLVKRYAGRAK